MSYYFLTTWDISCFVREAMIVHIVPVLLAHLPIACEWHFSYCSRSGKQWALGLTTTSITRNWIPWTHEIFHSTAGQKLVVLAAPLLRNDSIEGRRVDLEKQTWSALRRLSSKAALNARGSAHHAISSRHPWSYPRTSLNCWSSKAGYLQTAD